MTMKRDERMQSSSAHVMEAGIYRDDELRRAFKRARTVENNAPADPTRARTTVGFSGESVQPVWACNGDAINRKSADQKRNCTDLFINLLDLAQSIYWNKKYFVNHIVVGPGRRPKVSNHLDRCDRSWERGLLILRRAECNARGLEK